MTVSLPERNRSRPEAAELTDQPTDTLPAPPIGELDVSRFATVEVPRGLFLEPQFAELSVEAYRAQTRLVFAAWSEVPAGSIFDSDAKLAQCAGFGMDLERWRQVREECLAHWMRCRDGRFYFVPMLEAIEAAAGRIKVKRDQERARQRRRRLIIGLREVGVDLGEGAIEGYLPEIEAQLEARGGAALRKEKRALTLIASGLGILPGERANDVRLRAPMGGGRGFQPIAKVVSGSDQG